MPDNERTIHLIRHANAVDRDFWRGDDRLRPLSQDGLAQARRLAFDSRLQAVAAIYSSPTIRCLQTVEPLAGQLGLGVQVIPQYMEGCQLLLPLARGPNVAICAHGDNIPWTLDELGVKWTQCRKGSVWIIRLDDDMSVNESFYFET